LLKISQSPNLHSALPTSQSTLPSLLAIAALITQIACHIGRYCPSIEALTCVGNMRTTVVEEGGRGRGVIVAEPVVPVSSGCYTSLVFALFAVLLVRRKIRTSAALTTWAIDVEAEKDSPCEIYKANVYVEMCY
jgi:hypothetical protein